MVLPTRVPFSRAGELVRSIAADWVMVRAKVKVVTKETSRRMGEENIVMVTVFANGWATICRWWQRLAVARKGDGCLIDERSTFPKRQGARTSLLRFH